MANAKKGESKDKTQAAMEYLMTYGWAVFAIAIVVIVLFEFGVFRGVGLAPRAYPGSCMVYRPYGSSTTMDISLAGICQSELPAYVMKGFGPGDFVDVPGSGLSSSDLDIIGNNITITAWVYVLGSPYHDVIDKENQYGMKIDYQNSPHPCTPSNDMGLCLEFDTADDWNGVSFPIPNGGFNQWMFLAVSQNQSMKYWYANGALIGSEAGSNSLAYSNANVSIGAISPGFTGYGDAEWFDGSISNVQVYNSSLSQSSIQSLYFKGIGAPPQALSSLVAWWPLNGNSNDYGGNGNDGKVFNTSFSGVWYAGYSTP